MIFIPAHFTSLFFHAAFVRLNVFHDLLIGLEWQLHNADLGDFFL